MSNFSKTDDNELELFGNSHRVDSEEVTEMRGLKRRTNGDIGDYTRGSKDVTGAGEGVPIAAGDAGALEVGHLEGSEGGQGSQTERVTSARMDVMDWFGQRAGHGVAVGRTNLDMIKMAARDLLVRARVMTPIVMLHKCCPPEPSFFLLILSLNPPPPSVCLSF